MSILLDRLMGENLDEENGKDKLPVHQFIDAVRLEATGWTGAPTPAEINQAFKLQGQPWDPTNSQVADLALLQALPSANGQAKRSVEQIEAVFRVAEMFSTVITAQRVQDMLGVTLSST